MAGVKGRSGRKPKTVQRATTQRIITDTSPHAAQYLRQVIEGKVKPSALRIEVCKFIITHDLGRPRQKVNVGGAVGLVNLADVAREYDRGQGELEQPQQSIALIPAQASRWE